MAELILPFARPFASAAMWTAAGFAARLFAALRRQLAIRAALAELRSLDDRTLRDIGFHRSEIESIVCGDGLDRQRGR
jgi:uncharacterized protein YjiS (DUF1127 family)